MCSGRLPSHLPPLGQSLLLRLRSLNGGAVVLQLQPVTVRTGLAGASCQRDTRSGSSRATRSGTLTTTDDLSCGRRCHYPNALCFPRWLLSAPGCGALSLTLGKTASVPSLFCSLADRPEAANNGLAPQAMASVPAPLLLRTALLEWFAGIGTMPHAFRHHGVRTHTQKLSSAN